MTNRRKTNRPTKTEAAPPAAAQAERLQKVLARAGVASRRGAEKLIADGRVKVDGRPARLGESVDQRKQRITVDGRELERPEGTIYYMFHKPVGVVTTLSDPQKRPAVGDYTSGLKERVFPVGRLDRDASGLLILTNDGRLAQRLLHPKHGVDKTYLVEVRGRCDTKALRLLAKGVPLGDRISAPARVELIDRKGKEAVISLTIHEGRHHQVKRMCKQVGLVVVGLKRVRLGPIELGALQPGRMRKITGRNLARLKSAAGL